MKKSKLILGLTALCAAFVMAFASIPQSRADQYWTDKTASDEPAGIEILNPAVECESTGLCGYRFSDEGELLGTIPGEYVGG